MTTKTEAEGGVVKSAGSALQRPVTPSKELAAVVGADAIPRTQVVKKVWDYIKKHKLQDEANKRNINGDDKLNQGGDRHWFRGLDHHGLHWHDSARRN